MLEEDGAACSSDPTTPESALVDGRAAFFGFLAKRLGSRSDAEDVLQDFYLRVLAQKDQVRDVERMDAWLYAILRSTLNDFYRKSARRGRLADAVAREPVVSAEEAFDQLERLCGCSGGLIAELRPADAVLLQRIDFGDEERAGVAADLGLSRNALGVRLHRARAALRDALIEHCGPCCEASRSDCYCPRVASKNEDHGLVGQEAKQGR